MVARRGRTGACKVGAPGGALYPEPMPMTREERDACFEAWMAQHVAILHRVAHAFALGDDRHDLMQELLIAVWKAVPAFRGDAKPSTFIYRVTHNAALTWKRGQRSYRRRVEAFAAERPPESQPDRLPDHAALERLYAAIHPLPPVDRSLVLLSLDGLSHREIAAIPGLSEGNVAVRLHRIKSRLAQSQKEHSHGSP
jgi:RNA polymerase sigma factor (sigma-70 family)